jgi:hypothetical protein
MGSRNRSGLFLPDERGIGGAIEIAEEYKHFYTKCRTVTIQCCTATDLVLLHSTS